MITQITENGLTFNRADAPESGTVWRLVHDGVQVLDLFETSGQTDSIHRIADFGTIEEAEAEIATLGLIYQPSILT